jgi:site-specific recombinase XerD
MTEVGVGGRVPQNLEELIVGHYNDRAGLLGEGARQRPRKFALLLDRGVHPKLVQYLLGHASIQLTLDRYW